MSKVLKPLKFSLKSLLALLAIVATAFGWWVDHRRLTEQVQSLQEQRRLLELDHNDVTLRNHHLVEGIHRVVSEVQQEKRSIERNWSPVLRP